MKCHFIPIISSLLMVSISPSFGQQQMTLNSSQMPLPSQAGANAHNGNGNNVSFIENKGQWGHGIIYKTGITGGALFITGEGFVYNFANGKDMANAEALVEKGEKQFTIHYHAYKMNFVDANPVDKISQKGSEMRSNYNNYFIGNDKSKWQGKVRLYGKVQLSNVYNGIDLVAYTNANKTDNNISVNYDFIVAPGENPDQIKLSFDGVTPELSSDGNLIINTSVNKVVEQAPYCYQNINGEKVEVASRYRLKRGILSYEFPHGYNKSYALVIDPPILVFATFSGATTNAFYAHSTTYDSLGNTYASGLATGIGWPTTVGAYQTTYNSGFNYTACINKYNSVGTSLIFSTYFGASGGVTEPNTLRVDNSNNLVMGGATDASNLPITTGAYQSTLAGGDDIYISKFTPDGTTLLASTFVGGSGNEANQIGYTYQYTSLGGSDNPRNPVEITFDKDDNVWVTSNSASSNFPVTSGAEQSTLGGSNDAVVFKLSSDFTTLDYSSYLGGNSWDGGIGIEFDPDSNLVIVGMTNSYNFPTTTGALQTVLRGGDDGFVTRINPANGDILQSTYLGTTGTDDAERVAFDAGGNVYIAGRSMSGTYSVSTGAWSNPGGYIYVQKLSPDLSTSIKSTTVGSNNYGIVATGFMVDRCGNIVLGTLTTASPQTGLSLTADALQTTASPFYLVIIKSDFSQQLFGSYFGTNSDHFHPAVSRLDKKGFYYQSVCTTSSNFAPNPSYSAKKNGGTNDVGTFKIKFPPTGVEAIICNLNTLPSNNDSGCAPYTVTLHSCSTSPVDSMVTTWNPGDGSPLIYDTTFVHTYDSPGVYTITLHVHSDSACIQDGYKTFKITVLKIVKPELTVTPDTLVCNQETAINLWVHVANPDSTQKIKWYPSTGIYTSDTLDTISVNPSVPAFYVMVKDSIRSLCGSTSWDTVKIYNFPRGLKILTNDTTVCKGKQVQVLAQSVPGYTFRWSPSLGVNDSTLLSPVITANQSQTYTLTAHHPGCLDTAQLLTINVQDYPTVELGSNIELCQWANASLQSSVTPYRNDYSYQWSPVTGLDNPNGPNTHLNASDTANAGWYYLTVKTPVGCSGKDSVHITIFPGNFGEFPSDTGFCLPDTVSLVAGGGVAYHWTPSTGLSNDQIANPKAYPISSTRYTVYVKDVHGCLDTGNVLVSVYPGAVLTMPDSVTLYSGESYHLEPGTNCAYFTWFPTNGVNSTQISDPTFNPIVGTRYFVKATTENGCAIQDSIDVIVKGTVLNVPNAFTPGNGSNNVFKVEKRGIARLNDFSVYNRWGNKVFSTTDINQGWDGTFNGKPQPMGVYVYVIDAVTNGGQVIKKTGNVTLLR